MGAADLAEAHLHRGGNDSLRGQLFQQIAHGGNIRQSIQSAHFVEVDFRNGNAVNLALRLGDARINLQNPGLYGIGYGQGLNRLTDVCHGGVAVVVFLPMVVMAAVAMVVRVFLLVSGFLLTGLLLLT